MFKSLVTESEILKLCFEAKINFLTGRVAFANSVFLLQWGVLAPKKTEFLKATRPVNPGSTVLVHGQVALKTRFWGYGDGPLGRAPPFHITKGHLPQHGRLSSKKAPSNGEVNWQEEGT